MGKRIRVWLIRVVAVLIIAFMVLSLGANFFTAKNRADNETEQKQTSESKYKYVDENSKMELTGINQTLLIPRSMKLESTTNSEENNAIIYQYNSVQYDDIAAGMVIVEMDKDKGADYTNEVLFNIEEASQRYKEAEFENINYITLQGEMHDYLMTLQTIHENNPNYSYEVDYTIIDEQNLKQYMISLFLLEPKQASKTDMLQLDRMGKEVLSQTKYVNAQKYDSFCLPAGHDDSFNHIMG